VSGQLKPATHKHKITSQWAYPRGAQWRDIRTIERVSWAFSERSSWGAG